MQPIATDLRPDITSKSAGTAGKKIVLTTWGSFGDLHPYIALALELRARGHRPVIATCGIYRQKVESEGLEFHPVRPDLPPPDEDPALMARVMDPRRGMWAVMGVVVPHVRG